MKICQIANSKLVITFWFIRYNWCNSRLKIRVYKFMPG